jgi:hypothetical protein
VSILGVQRPTASKYVVCLRVRPRVRVMFDMCDAHTRTATTRAYQSARCCADACGPDDDKQSARHVRQCLMIRRDGVMSCLMRRFLSTTLKVTPASFVDLALVPELPQFAPDASTAGAGLCLAAVKCQVRIAADAVFFCVDMRVVVVAVEQANTDACTQLQCNH